MQDGQIVQVVYNLEKHGLVEEQDVIDVPEDHFVRTIWKEYVDRIIEENVWGEPEDKRFGELVTG